MAKLTRQTLQQFGSTVNPASEVGEFGSGATGSPTFTGSITLMQSLAAWGRGWAAETIANNRPFLEDMNAVDCVFGYMLSYLMQMGIPEYDAGTTYYTNSISQGSGTTWESLADTNIGNTPSLSSTAWTPFTAYISGQLGAWSNKSQAAVSLTVSTIFQATTDLWVAVGGQPAAGTINVQIFTDSSVTPTTIRAGFTNNSSDVIGNGTFVRKGDYYQVIDISSNTILGFFMYILPLGT